MSTPGTGNARPGRVGVRDVAQLAGVSTQTVSRVLNNSGSLRDETRDRVLRAMAELDYRPNNAARALGTATTRTLGVVATDVELYGPTVAIAELANAAREAGRWIATAYADASDEALVADAVDHVLGQGVDGIVVVAPHALTRDVVRTRAGNVPVVIMHADDSQARAAGLTVSHLAELGHRRIARLAGPPEWLEEESRRRGFEEACASHSVAAGPIFVGDWSAQSGARLAPDVAKAVRHPEGPTAIVVANDQMALGLMSGLGELGVDIPGQVSVAGFDDNPDSAFYVPSLTTVRIDVADEARRCVATIFGIGAGLDSTPPQLVTRRSTAPAN